MACAMASIFFVVITVCGSFSSLLLKAPNALFVAGAFMTALLLLVVAVCGLIRDILISLQAIKIEINYATCDLTLEANAQLNQTQSLSC